MKKGVVIGMLVLLCLSACAGKEDRESQALLGRAAGLDEEAVLLTVDGREVPAWRYLYWLAFTCDQVRDRYEEARLNLDWKIPVTGGSLGDYAKDQALADTVLYATVENWAETYGCVLTEADRASLSERWEEQAAAHGGEELYLAELESFGLNRVRAETLEGVGVLYGKLFQLYGETENPAMAALREKLDCLTVDRILVAAGEDREEARRRAEALFSRLNDGGADQEAVFSALAAEGDDPAGPRTLLPGGKTLDPILEEAAAALEEGQCSGILESAEGFSILRRLPPEPDRLEGGGFDWLLQQAAEDSLVSLSDSYARVDTAAFHQALRTLRAEGAAP